MDSIGVYVRSILKSWLSSNANGIHLDHLFEMIRHVRYITYKYAVSTNLCALK